MITLLNTKIVQPEYLTEDQWDALNFNRNQFKDFIKITKQKSPKKSAHQRLQSLLIKPKQNTPSQ